MIKNFFRTLLKNVLGFFAKIAVRKHDASLILITGWAGTGVVREMAYQILSRSYNTRRNVKEVWWDLSLPLTILGYEDKKRSLGEWIVLILRAGINLIIKKKYHHKIIINLDTYDENVAKYWTHFVDPDIVVALKQKPDSKIIQLITKTRAARDAVFIHNPKEFDNLPAFCSKRFVYSQTQGDLEYKLTEQALDMRYENQKTSVELSKFTKVLWEYIPPAVSVGIIEEISLQESLANLEGFSLHPEELKASLHKLKEFVKSDE